MRLSTPERFSAICQSRLIASDKETTTPMPVKRSVYQACSVALRAYW
jgi:hypothetical protein